MTNTSEVGQRKQQPSWEWEGAPVQGLLLPRHFSSYCLPPREAAAGWHHPPSPSQEESVLGSSSSPPLQPPPVKLTSLDQKLQLLAPLLSAIFMALKLICVFFFFLPNKPVGILNRAKETGDEAQGQLKASKNQAQCIQQNLQPSCQIVCWSHQVVRAGEIQTFTDFHQE